MAKNDMKQLLAAFAAQTKQINALLAREASAAKAPKAEAPVKKAPKVTVEKGTIGEDKTPIVQFMLDGVRVKGGFCKAKALALLTAEGQKVLRQVAGVK